MDGPDLGGCIMAHRHLRTFSHWLPVTVCTFFAPTILADTLHVPGDYATIQAAIDAAVTGDEVIVADGTYTGDGNKNLDFGGKEITVRSASGDPALCIIDCESIGCGFVFNSDESAGAIVADMKITNGAGFDTGDPDKLHGGGIYCREASPTITGCIIRDNTTTGESANGGGVYVRGGAPTFSNCVIRANVAQHWGGGIFLQDSGNATLINCLIDGNSGDSSGGGGYCEGHDASLINCAITRNAATFGAGFGCTASNLTMTNCVISENADGIAFYSFAATPTLTNCTITANVGTACRSVDSAVTITNCVLWNDDWPEIVIESGGSPTVSYSNVQGGWAGTGNLALDPLFAFPTDGHLLPTSPCIDSGTNAPAGGLPATDADGNARSLDGDGDLVAVTDMGAYEFNTAAPSIALSATRFDFIALPGGAAPTDQTLSLRNAGGATLNWEIANLPSWLSAAPASGSSSGEVNLVTLSVDTSGLPAGTYVAALTASDPAAVNTPRELTVELRLTSTLHVPAEYATIQAAIDAAPVGAQIAVADGTYTGVGNRDLDFGGKSITVGSASGDPTLCIIDCENAGRGIRFNSGEGPDSVFDGFTITNGSQIDGSGGGIACISNSSPTISNCVLRENVAKYGGGIFCKSSSPVVTGCMIADNTASNRGGGVRCWASAHPMLVNCAIVRNSSDHLAGGLDCQQSSDPSLTNCTITANVADTEGGGVYCSSASEPTFANCIVWGNTPDAVSADPYAPEFIYSDIEGGWTGAGNIDSDPLFLDPNNGDYHLAATSPCLDTGRDESLPGGLVGDLDGLPRITDGDGVGVPPAHVDMGAYERPALLPGDLNCDGVVDFGDINPFVLRLVDPVGYPAQHPGCIDENADVNGDQSVDFGDINAFVALLTGS